MVEQQDFGPCRDFYSVSGGALPRPCPVRAVGPHTLCATHYAWAFGTRNPDELAQQIDALKAEVDETRYLAGLESKYGEEIG